MTDAEHVTILKQGVVAWNHWRQEHPRIRPILTAANLSGALLDGAHLRDADLCGADLQRADLRHADLRWADLRQANLRRARLREADLRGANLQGADLSGADLRRTQLSGARLTEADLSKANLRGAHLLQADLGGAHLLVAHLHDANLHQVNLRGANLRGARLCRAYLYQADLSGANLSWVNLTQADLREAECRETHLRCADLSEANLSQACLCEADLRRANLRHANLRGANLAYSHLAESNCQCADLEACIVYGISAWGVHLEGARQVNLRITRDDVPAITLDDFSMAQFVSLLLEHAHLTTIITPASKKVALILGRCSAQQKPTLVRIQETIRHHHYVPVLYDVSSPLQPGVAETLTTLAQLASFVIVDLTEPSMSLDNLAAIVERLAAPVKILFLQNKRLNGMALHKLSLVSAAPAELYWYKHIDHLLAAIHDEVMGGRGETRAVSRVSMR